MLFPLSLTDSNTKFFHDVASTRKKRNKFQKLVDDQVGQTILKLCSLNPRETRKLQFQKKRVFVAQNNQLPRHIPSYVWCSIYASQILLKEELRRSTGSGANLCAWGEPWLRNNNRLYASN
ncbi:hypothetical protein JHK85_043756 [Glycine max]|nr:hypothetical protein JHK85_043756 [Glycine max]